MTPALFDRTTWPFLALLASAAMLAIAHSFEHFLGLAPCQLCYLQRQIFWVSGGVALISCFVIWRGAPPSALLAINVILTGIFLVSAGVAAYHSLVEWKLVPAPPCAAAKMPVSGDLWGSLGEPQKVPSCDVALWRMFGLSMANLNVLASLALAGLSAIAVRRAPRVDTANEAPAE
ncbi:MAG: disulfide bond formation protein B [Hyphomonadaceae bacterium]